MEIEMGMNGAPKPPVAGIIYGEITYWVAIVGVIISVVGIVIYLTLGGYIDKASVLGHLWRGDTAQAIWKECAGVAGVPHEYWYLERLGNGDCLAMLGIAVACVAGVVGMWGAVLGLLLNKGGIYIIFAFIIAVIVSLSASGILTIQ
jgi:hypothetical protein